MGLAEPVPVNPPELEITVYPVIAEPPLLTGAGLFYHNYLKSLNSTHIIVRAVLKVGVLNAIVEVLSPCVGIIELSRTPIVATSKTANCCFV